MPIRYGFYMLLIGLAAGAYLQKRYDPSTSMVQDNVHTVVKEVIRPDGSVEKQTETIDTSVHSVVVPKLADWAVGLGTDFKQGYTLQVNRRVLGPVFLNGWVSTNQSLGAGVLIEF